MKHKERLSDLVDSTKYLVQELAGFSAYHVLPRRNVVCLVSSMRAGSTLMKALLGQADDVSHLPEYDFSTLNSFSRNRACYILMKLAPEKHLILKKPRWFSEKSYPSVPPLDCKVIVLFRDMPGVVNSLMKRWPDLSMEDAIAYWQETYSSILENLKPFPQERVHYTSYQDLLKNPKEATAKLFQFIGSQQSTGVLEYKFPKSGKWEWGKDDGSGNIFSMSVRSTEKEKEPQVAIELSAEDTVNINRLNEQYAVLTSHD